MFLGLPDPYVAAREEMNPGESGLWRVSSLVREVCCCSTRQLGREALEAGFSCKAVRRGLQTGVCCGGEACRLQAVRAVSSLLYRLGPCALCFIGFHLDEVIRCVQLPLSQVGRPR